MPELKRQRISKATKIEATDLKTSRRRRDAVLGVPTEIWLEIVSNSNFLIHGTEKDGTSRSVFLLSRRRFKGAPPSAYWTRPKTLRALSQTCRTLRSIFIPLLWEHVEAGTSWPPITSVIIKRCNGLIKSENQHLAIHVRVFSVSVPMHRSTKIAPVLAQCLQSLPNLHTLHVPYVEGKLGKTFTAAFKNIQLPTVKTIILPCYAHAILEATPNVRDVSCNRELSETLFDTLVKRCRKVERIQGFRLTSEKLNKLSESSLKLREVAVPAYTDTSSLSVIKSLSVIELFAESWDYVDGSEIGAEDVSLSTARKRGTMQKRIDGARAVLEASADEAPKRIKISYWQSIPTGVVAGNFGPYWVRAEEFDV
ncbi:hypothetical protein FB451DRAFT_1310994 [Mycena latifolia]|nr:hypothetical protein FB451DRAFT_1310994 [Mycena latifolia]